MKYNVRFAPSPSGYLHVGGARTAIFNWLTARISGGNFLLRIEDTDRLRSTNESIQQIIASLKWLNIDWDREIVFQSINIERHKEAANQLLESSKAYRCFCSREELDEKRLYAQKNKLNKFYDGTCRGLTSQQIEQNIQEHRPFSIRFKVDQEDIRFYDIIRGDVSVSSETLDDFIIVRSDGNPVYQLAVVVDDHDMGINLVLRGEDHLSNTPKQIMLYKALNWELPRFAHLPLILGTDKKRLSKRQGAASVEEFREQGILSETMFNYLSLLGWSPKTEQEFFSRDEVLEKFSLENLNKNAAVFDNKKLEWFNKKHIAALPFESLNPFIDKWLLDENITVGQKERESFLFYVKLLQSRAKTLNDLGNSLKLFFHDPESYNPKAVNKIFKKEGVDALLSGYKNELETMDDVFYKDTEIIEKHLRNYTESLGISAAKIIHPLRLALVGTSESIGIFELVSILGRQKVLSRIENGITFIKDKISCG